MLTRHVAPLHPDGTGTMTRFGTAVPGLMLIFEAFGGEFEWGPGYAVSTVLSVGAIAVRLNTTAVTPVEGIGLGEAVTLTLRMPSGPMGCGTDEKPLHGLLLIPGPVPRVSQILTGAVGVNFPGDPEET